MELCRTDPCVKTDGAEYQIVFFPAHRDVSVVQVDLFVCFLLAVFKLLSIFCVMLPVRTFFCVGADCVCTFAGV